MSDINTFIQKLKSAARWYVEPAEPWDVASLADTLHITFPKAYHEFLCGAGNGFMPLEGSQYCIEDDLVAVQRRARSIARKNNLNLPDDAFVFLEHQGYAYNFFLLYDGEDPPVYELVDGVPKFNPPSSDGGYKFERVSSTFSNWISSLVDKYIARCPHQ